MTLLDVVAALLALLAALLFAVASVAQRGAAGEVPDEAAAGRRLAGRLVRSRRWWSGVAGDSAAFAAQAAALGLGSVLLVQPLLVTTVVFALPLEVRGSGRTIATAQRWWSAALVVALALFVLLGQPSAGADRAPWSQWLPSVVVLALVAAACAVGAGRRRGRRRATLLAVAAGLVYGLVGALAKSVVALLGTGLLGVLRGWETWVLVVAVVVGTLLQQVAFGAGPLSASLPAVTVGEPLASAVLGMVVLGEHIRTTGPAVAVIGVSVVAVTVATAALARAAIPVPPGGSSSPSQSPGPQNGR